MTLIVIIRVIILMRKAPQRRGEARYPELGRRIFVYLTMKAEKKCVHTRTHKYMGTNIF